MPLSPVTLSLNFPPRAKEDNNDSSHNMMHHCYVSMTEEFACVVMLHSLLTIRSLINKSFFPISEKAMNFANMELNWQLGDVTTSVKGIKSAPLTDGKTAVLTFD